MSYYGWNGKDDSEATRKLSSGGHPDIGINLLIDSDFTFNEIADT